MSAPIRDDHGYTLIGPCPRCAVGDLWQRDGEPAPVLCQDCAHEEQAD
jgi:hypothetical protein